MKVGATGHGGEPNGLILPVNHLENSDDRLARRAAKAMKSPPMDYLLSHDPIPDSTPPFGPGLGAEARFLGVVRELEDGRVIAGIEYSAYLPMAEKMLAAIVAEARAAHGGHEVFIQHRLGFVAAAAPSILIRVRTRHSAEAFDLCRWYLKEVKTRVPIWKRPVFDIAAPAPDA